MEQWKMKRINLIILILIMSLMCLADTVDRIVAKVGREVILQTELDSRYESLEALGTLEELMSKEEVLEKMIENELILLKANELEIEIDDYQISQMVEQELEGIRAGYSSEVEFRQSLKRDMGYSVTELREYLEKLFRERRLQDELISMQVVSQIHITDLEIEEYYQEHEEEMPMKQESDKIGMIMLEIKASEETKNKLKKEIYELKDMLNKGAEFSELARKYSDCGSSKEGGDLGYVSKGIMVKPFEDVAFSLNPGEISELVETQFGYHLIYLQEKKEDQIKVSHILLKLKASDKDRNKIKSKVEDIKQQLDSGEDFSELARKYSEDESSAEDGGVIGEFPEEEYPELFSSYLKALDYGEETEVIEQEDNLYIFSKMEKVPARRYTYKELYSEIKNRIYEKKQKELYEKWMKSLKKETYIEIYL